MLRIAGQTAGPIRLICFVDTHGWPGGVISGFFTSFIFFPRATPGISASLFSLPNKCFLNALMIILHHLKLKVKKFINGCFVISR